MKFESAQSGVPVVENPKAQERFEKGKEAFRDSYETALMFRDFAHGWGEFSDKEGLFIWHNLFRLVDRVENSATIALSGNEEIIESRRKEMIAEAITIQSELTVFERMKRLPGFPVSVEWLRRSLENNDTVSVLKAAVTLRAMTSGMEYMNQLLLRPADKVTETPNTLNG